MVIFECTFLPWKGKRTTMSTIQFIRPDAVYAAQMLKEKYRDWRDVGWDSKNVLMQRISDIAVNKDSTLKHGNLYKLNAVQHGGWTLELTLTLERPCFVSSETLAWLFKSLRSSLELLFKLSWLLIWL